MNSQVCQFGESARRADCWNDREFSVHPYEHSMPGSVTAIGNRTVTLDASDAALENIDAIWEELFPAEQQRIVRLEALSRLTFRRQMPKGLGWYVPLRPAGVRLDGSMHDSKGTRMDAGVPSGQGNWSGMALEEVGRTGPAPAAPRTEEIVCVP